MVTALVIRFTFEGMYKLKPDEIAEKIIEVADVEAHATANIASSGSQISLANSVHRFCSGLVITTAQELSLVDSQSTREVIEGIKEALIERINSLTHVLLKRALSGCRLALGAKVHYELCIPPLFEDDDPATVRFAGVYDENDWFESVLRASLKIRHSLGTHQRMAVSLAKLIGDCRLLKQSISYEDVASNFRLKLAEKIAERKSFGERLPREVFDSVETFEFYLFRANQVSFSIPRQISLDETGEELQKIADLYANFGNALTFFRGSDVKGPVDQCHSATQGWKQFHSCSRALKVISCWLRALSIRLEERLCPLCYRHSANKTRCLEHATFSHETAAGRLAKRIRPEYLQRAETLLQDHSIRDVVSRPQFSRVEDDLMCLARCVGVDNGPPEIIERVNLLCKQLQIYRAILNTHLNEQLKDLLKVIFQSTLDAYKPENIRTLAGLKSRQTAFERVSLRGFFMAWFGDKWPALSESKTHGLRHDRYHPVNKGGSLDISNLPRQLLMQRSWHEAEDEFKKRLMPSVADLELMLRSGLTQTQISKKLGISRQTISKRLSTHRVRNRLSM